MAAKKSPSKTKVRQLSIKSRGVLGLVYGFRRELVTGSFLFLALFSLMIAGAASKRMALDQRHPDVLVVEQKTVDMSGVPAAEAKPIPTPLSQTCNKPVICDVNKDGKENNLDGQYMKDCMRRTTLSADCAMVDVNCDEKVTTGDIVAITEKCPGSAK